MARGWPRPPYGNYACILALAGAPLLPLPACALAENPADSTAQLKELSLDELLNIEVSSVSRRAEKLANAASAIQVISGEAIQRSGATNLPEALRLATNLQVAQVNSSQWAISARGFNNVLANKLLVLLDGRTIYTPLYAGVFWDAHDVMLADLDRIEVISGPGGTLWGANAVNGVINISTRRASETQGLLVEAGGGGETELLAALRYGGHLTERFSYRVYGKAFERDDTILLNGADAGDAWRGKRGGFRTDWEAAADTLTVQGDIYRIHPNPDGTVAVESDGHNLLGRWRHTFTDASDLQVQLYYDHVKRDFRNGFVENRATYDLDTQHRFALGGHQEVVWGIGTRWAKHEVTNLQLFRFLPPEKILRSYSAFVQDELSYFDKELRVALGVKYENNEYTGSEWQPNIRVAWTPVDSQTLWAAASRAVRTPARIDRDFYLSLTPTLPFVVGGDFESETVYAYELGWRSQAFSRVTTSAALFFNEYDNLRSVEPGPPPFNLPATFDNGVAGDTYGLELSASIAVTNYWQLRAGYTWLRKHLHVKPGSRDLNNGSSEANDPENQALLQSMLSLPWNLAFDGVLRYVDALHTPRVPSYVELDLRLAWRPIETLELSLVGQNLLDDSHPEFVPSSPSAREIERNIYGKIAWRY